MDTVRVRRAGRADRLYEARAMSRTKIAERRILETFSDVPYGAAEGELGVLLDPVTKLITRGFVNHVEPYLAALEKAHRGEADLGSIVSGARRIAEELEEGRLVPDPKIPADFSKYFEQDGTV